MEMFWSRNGWSVSRGSFLFIILLMDKILHQLRLVVYPIIYRVLYIPGGAGFLPSTVSSNFPSFFFKSINSRANLRSPGPLSKRSPPKTKADSASFNFNLTPAVKLSGIRAVLITRESFLNDFSKWKSGKNKMSRKVWFDYPLVNEHSNEISPVSIGNINFPLLCQFTRVYTPARNTPFSLVSTDALLSTYRQKVSMSPSRSVMKPMS